MRAFRLLELVWCLLGRLGSCLSLRAARVFIFRRFARFCTRLQHSYSLPAFRWAEDPHHICVAIRKLNNSLTIYR